MISKLTIIRTGFANVYLLEQNAKFLLIDTGIRKQEKIIENAITARGTSLQDLKLIFLTHSHYDHTGNAARLKAKTQAKIVIQETEAENLINGFTTIPKGTSLFYKILTGLSQLDRRKRKPGSFEPFEADITFEENFSLKPFGFDAEIIHTPGHTAGSSSLIVGDKAIVGDSMFNMLGSYYPGFANDERALHETWRKLFALDVNWYYPSHGKRIKKELVMDQARKRKII